MSEQARAQRSTGQIEVVATAAAAQALALAAASAAADRYARGALAPATLRGYRSDWSDFATWCALAGLQALPSASATVALYCGAHAGRLKVATLRRHLAAISAVHRDAGEIDPTKSPEVKAVMRGAAREHGTAPHRKTPLVIDALRLALAELGEDTVDVRDRALLLVGWAGALRRSELIAIDVADLERQAEGIALHVRRSKTDQEGRGRIVGLPNGRAVATSPVAALDAWLSRAGITSGAVFRPIDRWGIVSGRRLGDRTVARVVQAVCKRAGLQGDYSGHSLRAGLATSAAAAGASERSIMSQTGHRSLMVARAYIRPASLWLENAAAVAAL